MSTSASMNMRPGATARAPAPRPRGGLLLGAMIWVMIVLMIVPNSLEYNAVGRPDDDGGNPTTRVIWILFLVFSVVTVVRNMGATRRLLKVVNPWFIVFVALAFASILWSIDPALTLRRLVRLTTMVLATTAVVVAAWHPRRFQAVIRPIITLMLVGSLVFGLGWPELAIHDSTSPELIGAWHGLATQKNGFGALASFGFVLWVHAWLSREAKLPVALLGAAVAGACVILSRSSTSLMVTILTTLFLLTLVRTPRGLKRYMRYLVSALALLILVYSMAILHIIPGSGMLLSPIAAITGKDQTFTGRAEIWALIVDHINLRPLKGSGYGAFWGGEIPGTDSYYVKQALQGFYPGSAHNGYLDVLNDLGILGLVTLIGYLVVHLRQSLKLFAVDRPQGALFLALFLQQGLSNMSESHWFSVTSLDFVLMTLASMNLGRAMVELRWPRQPAPAVAPQQMQAIAQPAAPVPARAGRGAPRPRRSLSGPNVAAPPPPGS